MDQNQRDRIYKHWTAPIEHVIAEERLIMVVRGERREVTLQIGKPVDHEDGTASCAWAAWGMFPRSPDAISLTTFYALMLAMESLKFLVEDCVRLYEAKIYYPGEEEDAVPINSILATQTHEEVMKDWVVLQRDEAMD